MNASNPTTLKRFYYAANVADFLHAGREEVLGHLAIHHAHDLDPLQRQAWLTQISVLQEQLSSIGRGWLALEFSSPRMGKRVDTVVLLDGVIFVLEFKVGTEQFDRSA